MKNWIHSLLVFLLLVSPLEASRDYDASADWLDCGTMNDLISENSALTFSIWAYFDGANENGSTRFFHRSNTGFVHFLPVDSTNDVRFEVGGSTPLVRITAGSQWTTGAWTHFLVTWDGSTTAANVHIYINGTEPSYATTTNGVTPANVTSNVYLGNNSDFQNRTMNGKLAEAAAWSGVLSGNDIASLAAGAHPFTITNQTLFFYAPLYGISSPEPDFAGGDSPCTVSGPVRSDHPVKISVWEGRLRSLFPRMDFWAGFLQGWKYAFGG